MRSIPRRLVMITVLSLIGAVAAATAAAEPEGRPHAMAAEQRSPHERTAVDDHESDDTGQPHRQKTSQRPSSERVETAPHDSLIVVEPPPDVFESPEAKAADHIPKPLPSDEVRVKRRSLKAATRKSDLEMAWQLYDRRRYEEAAEGFAALIAKDPLKAMNACLGLAYSRLQQGRREETVAQLDHLVRQRYRMAETLPLLLGLLEEGGDFETARTYLHLLPPQKRNHWNRRLLAAQAAADHRALENKKAPGTEAWVGFIDRHRPALEACIRPDLFFDAATQLHAGNESARAIAVQRALLACDLPPDLRLGIVDQLSGLLAPEAAIDLLREEKRRFRQAAPQHLAEIDQLEIRALKRKLGSLVPGSGEQLATAKAILELAPADREALEVVAWDAFAQRDYSRSESLFVQLRQQAPGNRDYALGLGYSRLKLGRHGEALQPLDPGEFSEDARIQELKAQIYSARARLAYSGGDWPAAAEDLEAALKIDPEDTASKELLAWTRFQQQRPEEALAIMEEVYTHEKDPDTGGALLDMYQSTGNTARSWGMAKRMAAEEDPAARQKAADFFFTQGAPVSAAQVGTDDRACYAGADSPRGEVSIYQKYKSGDDGTSKLYETALPITIAYPTALGNTWSLSLTPRYLSSGDASDTPFAGSYYRFLNGDPQVNDLEDGLPVMQPDVGFAHEGRVSIDAHLGTSPIGGAVDPTPTLALRLSTGSWYADLHRCTVKDSILSYTGLEDPYNSREWGRVTRNGFSAGTTLPLLEDYWLSIAAGYDRYDGAHLWDNDSYHFDAAAGRSFDHNGNELTVGLFLTAQHFRRNSDFYTYGHGGYYSPELMTLIGPFVRYRTALCRTYWFDLQVSAGWLHQRLDDSPVYPLFSGDVTGFTPAAAADALARYGGDTDNKLGLSAKIQGMKLITDKVAVGGFGAIDNNSDYTRWQMGAGVQIFFESQNLFWQRRDFFRDFGDCSNR